MARIWVPLDQNIQVTTTSDTVQANRFAADIGAFKDGVAYLRVFSNASSGFTLRFLHAIDGTAPNADWFDNTTEVLTVGSSATGVFKTTISDPGMFIRWKLAAAPSATIVFTVELLMNDYE